MAEDVSFLFCFSSESNRSRGGGNCMVRRLIASKSSEVSKGGLRKCIRPAMELSFCLNEALTGSVANRILGALKMIPTF